jgi:hypothetical protein
MVAATGISLRSVEWIWASHGLQLHRVRQFKLSHSPEILMLSARPRAMPAPA